MTSLYNLLKHEKIGTIMNNLENTIMKINKYCLNKLGKKIGSGNFSEVYLVDKITMQHKNEKFNIDVVEKALKKHFFKPGNFIYKKMHNNELYIHAKNSFATEIIILYFISKYWLEGSNPHLPFMIGFCIKEKNVLSILLEKNGYDIQIKYDTSKYIRNIIGINSNPDNRYSQLITLCDLIKYILCNYDDDKLTYIFPIDNTEPTYIPDLVDEICMFLIYNSYYFWNKMNLSLYDQHDKNIYLYNLKNGRCGNREISKLKHIYYQIDKDIFLKININHFIMKIGDVGHAILNSQKNVHIIGHVENIDNVITHTQIFRENNKFYMYYMLDILQSFPMKIIKETKFYKLFNKHSIYDKMFLNYNKLTSIGIDKTMYDKIPSEQTFLTDAIFDDIKHNKSIDDDENFTIFI